MDRIVAGDTNTPLPALADDELGRLAERQNQLAGDLLRRNRQVARVVDAVGTYSPREGADRLVDLAIADARAAFGLIDARIVLGDPSDIPAEERVPGDPLPIRADLRAGCRAARRVGGPCARHRALGSRRPGPPGAVRGGRRGRPAQRRAVRARGRPERAAARARRGEGRLPARRQPQPPDAAGTDPCLRRPAGSGDRPTAASGSSPSRATGSRGWCASCSPSAGSTPASCTRCRGLRPGGPGSVAPGRRSARPAFRSRLDDRAGGMARARRPRPGGPGDLGPARQRREVRRRHADHGERVRRGQQPIAGTAGTLRLRVADAGPGIADADRGRLFERYARGSPTGADGTGLGLYVSRELARANGGDLVLEQPEAVSGDPRAGDAADPARSAQPSGATFILTLPAESPTEG